MARTKWSFQMNIQINTESPTAGNVPSPAADNVRARQKPLRKLYRESPESALVTDTACTRSIEPNDPFHTIVEDMVGSDVMVPISVHSALGGLHDAPTPGDMLCAAFAACMDSSIRMVANILHVEFQHLEVRVSGKVDVRGTMGIDRHTPVGFQGMACEVNLQVVEGTDPSLVKRLHQLSIQSCVVGQTLLHSPEIHFSVEN